MEDRVDKEKARRKEEAEAKELRSAIKVRRGQHENNTRNTVSRT